MHLQQGVHREADAAPENRSSKRSAMARAQWVRSSAFSTDRPRRLRLGRDTRYVRHGCCQGLVRKHHLHVSPGGSGRWDGC